MVDNPFDATLDGNGEFIIEVDLDAALTDDHAYDGAFDGAYDRADDQADDQEKQGAGRQRDESSELLLTDLAEFFGAAGPLAEALDGYELRASQLAMAQAVKQALLDEQVALVEAPTGTGKSIAYLLPAILSGKTVIVATANKSLQNQLYTKDIPFLRRVLNREISAVVVKGRSNYVCNLKWEREVDEQRTIAIYDKEDPQVRPIRDWLTQTETGDVDDLPFMLNADLRPRMVSFADDCLHSECRHFYDNCWVNQMRDRAAEAQIIITNHHLLLNALELGFAGERILPPASVYVVDEAHQLEQTATAVYETSVTDYTVEQLLQRTVYREHVDEDQLDALRLQNTFAFQEVSNLSRDNSYRIEAELEQMQKLGNMLRDLAQRLKQRNPYGNGDKDLDDYEDEPPASKRSSSKASGKSGKSGKPGGKAAGKGAKGMAATPPRTEEEEGEARRSYELGIEALGSAATKMLTVCTAKHDSDRVRFAVRIFDRRHVSLEIHAAPINPAGLLTKHLFHPTNEDGPNKDGKVARTVICTSATLATNGRFEHFKARCGIQDGGIEAVLPAVFDYPNQALLYQPALPAFNFRAADTYYDAAAHEIERLIEVSRGRTLCLFTSWSGLQQVNDRLQNLAGGVIWPLRAQGDAPRNALLSWFLSTSHSVLLATRSFWEGVDIPGDDLSLVIMDKMPFPTPNDPLHSARMKALEDEGRSSFAEYMTPLMTLTLKQGFGRLIRRAGDIGVVAILDERLTSKAYGRQARQDLPPARFSREFKEVHRFYQSAFSSEAEYALNVWARAEPSRGMVGLEDDVSGKIRWRWQLLRLMDGKAESVEGTLLGVSPAEAEVHAIVAGLADLQRRVSQTKRSPRDYAVEVRCTLAALEFAMRHSPAAWKEMRQLWRDVKFITLERDVPVGV